MPRGADGGYVDRVRGADNVYRRETHVKTQRGLMHEGAWKINVDE